MCGPAVFVGSESGWRASSRPSSTHSARGPRWLRRTLESEYRWAGRAPGWSWYVHRSVDRMYVWDQQTRDRRCRGGGEQRDAQSLEHRREREESVRMRPDPPEAGTTRAAISISGSASAIAAIPSAQDRSRPNHLTGSPLRRVVDAAPRSSGMILVS